MLAQRLRHRVDIQQNVETFSGSGEPTGFGWATLYSDVPAEMVPLSGREFLAANAEQSEITTRCTIRYLGDVVSSMRIVHAGLAHNILAVLPDPTYRQHLTLMLSAGLRYDDASAPLPVPVPPDEVIIDGGGDPL